MDYISYTYLSLMGMSFAICALIILLARGKYAALLVGNLPSAVQTMHTRPTPRLGGLGIFAALTASMMFVSSDISAPYRNFILSTSLLFFISLAEDLRFGISPRQRLLAAIGASLFVILSLGVWMPRTDIPFLDAGMGFWMLGVPLTLLVTSGIANGFNLIDGVNGLASFTGIVAAVALALIAREAGYYAMTELAMMLAFGVGGFFLLNYPFGRIFLGDAGAYTLGFVLSWFAISILLNTPLASPWALLLTLFWPVADTLLAIWRRALRKSSVMAPDRLHVHHLVMRALEIHILGRGRRHIANPLTTLLLAPFISAPPLVGVLLWDDTRLAVLAVLGFTALFLGSYLLAFPILRRMQRHPAGKMTGGVLPRT